MVDERLALLRDYCADVAREIHFGLQIDRNLDSVEQWLDRPAVHVLRGRHADMGQHRVTDSFGHDGIERAGRCRAQPGQQHCGGFAARVTLLGAERGQLFLGQNGGRDGGGTAGQERQGDRGGDVGEDGPGACPVRVQQRRELVGRRHAASTRSPRVRTTARDALV